jgi:hypothetical protein
LRGLLSDENIQGHVVQLRRLLGELDLLTILELVPVEFADFRRLGIAPGTDDRSLWEFCQRDGWVLFTANRNRQGLNSLEAALDDLWRPGLLPVITIASKSRFELDRPYAELVAAEVAELLFGIHDGNYCDQPRIFVPR